MKYFICLSLSLFFFSISCSKANFGSLTSKNKSSSSPDLNSSTTTSEEEKSDKSDSGDKQTSVADTPIDITGTYLTCELATGYRVEEREGFATYGCTLMSPDNKKLVGNVTIDISIIDVEHNNAIVVPECRDATDEMPWNKLCDVEENLANTKFVFTVKVTSGSASKSWEIPNPLAGVKYMCGQKDNDCYHYVDNNTNLKEGKDIIYTHTGKMIRYATNKNGMSYFKEEAGDRILRSNGKDDWQRKLQIDGNGPSSDYFINVDDIAGRVCPSLVYIDDSKEENKASTGNCLYFHDVNASVESPSNFFELELKSLSSKSWYAVYIKDCGDKGMRLPTLFETKSSTPPSNLLPDETTTWNKELGVPSATIIHHSLTATSYTAPTWYWGWRSDIYNAEFRPTVNIRCVIP